MHAAEAVVGSLWAVGAGILVPGWLVAGRTAFGRDALERLVVAVAVGRLLLVCATLLATATAGAGALPFAAGLCLGALAVRSLLRRRRADAAQGREAARPPDASLLLPLLVAAAAALLLVVAVVARSGWGAGELVFYGRDSATDPWVYGAYALRLLRLGPPTHNPFAADAEAVGSYGVFSELAGLHAVSGVPMLTLAYRTAPCFEAVALGITAVALVRVFTRRRAALLAAPLLLLLGGGAGLWLVPLGALVGVDVAPIESWFLFGPYLLAFNPVAPAIQTLMAALLLLLGPSSPRWGPVLGGVLVGFLFELKLFLWATFLAGLCAAAVWRAPPALARRLRVGAVVAAVASLPSIAERAASALRLASSEDTGFQLCVGCFARWMRNAAVGDHDVSVAMLRDFRWAELLDPSTAADALGSTLLVFGLGLGARLLAVPALLRGARGHPDPSVRALHRIVLVAAGLGLLAASLVTTPPHYLNAVQFAWAATFGLTLVLALALPRWIEARRAGLVVALVLLAAPGSLDVLFRMGFGAGVTARVSAAERELVRDVGRVAGPDDVVLEPSMLVNPDVPSPVPLLTGRPVHLSFLGAVLHLPAAERERRFRQLVAFYVGRDRTAALAALRETGASYVLLPAGWELGFEPRPALEAVARNEAGSLYRVRE